MTKKLKLTFKDGRDFEHAESSNRQHLSQGQLHEKHGDARENKCYEVWYKESTAAIFVTQIGETPHVAKTDRETND